MLLRLSAFVQNVLVSVGSAVLLLGAGEGLCRLAERGQAGPPPAARTIADWASWDGEFYTVNSMATGRPPWDEFNRDGVRDRDHELTPAPGVRRVACLGDSTTVGYGLPARQAYPQVLQDLLDAAGARAEVFNVALAGWSPRQERIAYRRIVRRYQPQDVVVGLCLNDVAELQNNLSRPPRALSVLFARSALVRRAVDARGREIRAVEELFEPEPSARVRDGYRRLRKELRGLRQDVEADGARLAVVILPFRFQVRPGAPAPRAQQEILAFCAAERIPALDLLPALQAAGEAAFLDEDHFTAGGNRLIAEQLLTWRALGLAASGPPAPPATTAHELTAALAAPEPAERARAAFRLGRREARDPEAVAALLRALEDEDAHVRWRAAEALALIRPEPGSCLSALARIAADPRAPGRADAAELLGRLGPRAGPAVAALADALQDERPAVRLRAAWALGEIGPRAAKAAPALIAAMDDPAVRWRAAEALGGLGPSGRAAVPVLVTALRDPSSSVRLHAARSLGRLGASEALAELTAALDDPQRNVRLGVLRALSRLRLTAEQAAGPYLHALAASDPVVRAAAARELGRLPELTDEAHAALFEALEDPSADVREAAARALPGGRRF